MKPCLKKQNTSVGQIKGDQYIQDKIVCSEHKYWLGLKLSTELRNRLYVYVKKAGSPKKLWEMKKEELYATGLEAIVADSFDRFRKTIDLDLELSKIENKGVKIITPSDDNYPKQLKNSNWHPGAIFIKGNPKQYKFGVAIVGSRRATSYGKTIAYELGFELTKAGVAVISGGARGIDTAAHKGALDADGPTYSVFGCGLNIDYPPENKALFKAIIKNGAIFSEYPLDTPPLSHHFPIRNRIVAGMCDAVVVVEAGLKSGAIITADFALEYGRDVFAAPGYSKSEVSKGTNKLIKQGAFLIETADDILEVLGVEAKDNHSIEQVLTQKEQEFLQNLEWLPKSIEDIICNTELSVAQVSMMLVKLEIAGFIKKDISGNYLRLH